ncbi:MAG: precorrin-3B C(17)-methyltransferase [Spirochaetaceae bacterium]|jgi:precorrin-3B C17-methyltransferase|nr:precorrin-3B C(17)-methyltransferase [Spirochaetaceae bacterium]
MNLYVIGLGPGDEKYLTAEARRALEACQVVVGYQRYLDLIQNLIVGKKQVSTPMGGELKRCRMALGFAAEGKPTALVCSGDAGVYGLAGPVYCLAPEYPGVEVVVVPGITAALSAAALLGAPLTNDFAVISLSDLLTPWEEIEARLSAAAAGGFPLCLYNPGSAGRRGHLAKACDIVLDYRGVNTVCGVVSRAGREGEKSRITSLGELRNQPVDMFTTVIIGGAGTALIGGKMVTPRGYRGEGEQPAVEGAFIPEKALAKLEGERPLPFMTLFVFAGTTEGRLLIEAVRRSVKGPCRMRVFTASGYGKELLEKTLGEGEAGEGLFSLELRPGRLDAEGIYRELLLYEPDYVIDATHPYAVEVTKNIRDACSKARRRYLRLEREAFPLPPELPVRYAETMEDAADLLSREEGKIFLATGSKELEPFARPELRDRVFVRILPLEEGLKKCRALGFSPAQVIALQGPFEEEVNRALLRHTGASWLVTKETGEAGGFPEKLSAAGKEGVSVVILKHPETEEHTGVYPGHTGVYPGYTLEGILEILRKGSPAFFADEKGG